jgi:hypothetical protein
VFLNKYRILAGASALAKQEYGGKFGVEHIVFFVYNMPAGAFAAIFLCAVCKAV